MITATVYFLISPVSEGHSELLARTSPTIYDVLIGFFGGAAGIFAIASKNKGNVIPGVAIATALMPPLCTAGYGLATLQLNYFFGAFYLFIINSIYIGLATFLGVKAMNFVRHPSAPNITPKRQSHIRRLIYGVAILTLLPSVYLTYNMLRQESFQQNAARFVAAELHFPATQVLSRQAQWKDGVKTLTITLIGRVLPQDSLELALASQLPAFHLQGTQLRIIQGEAPTELDPEMMLGRSVKDIYDFAQTSLLAKQQAIDSLQTVLARQAGADTVSARIAPELRVVFPQVKQIAITRAVFGSVVDDSQRLDTANIALVQYARPMNNAQRRQLAEYLQARLAMKNVKLVTVSND